MATGKRERATRLRAATRRGFAHCLVHHTDAAGWRSPELRRQADNSSGSLLAGARRRARWIRTAQKKKQRSVGGRKLGI